MQGEEDAAAQRRLPRQKRGQAVEDAGEDHQRDQHVEQKPGVEMLLPAGLGFLALAEVHLRQMVVNLVACHNWIRVNLYSYC